MAVGLFDTFAFVLGASTFFAPCAFPLLPGYVSYYVGREGDAEDVSAELLRAVGIGVVVSSGFFVVYGALGGTILVFGKELLGNVTLLELFVGTVMIGLGSAMLAGYDLSIGHVQLPERRRSVAGFFAFGVLYAAAAAGCTATLFFGVVVNGLLLDPLAGVGTLVAYALGMSVVMIGITVAAALGRDLLVRRLAARTGTIQRVAGALLVLAGFAQVYFFLFWYDGLATIGLT